MRTIRTWAETALSAIIYILFVSGIAYALHQAGLRYMAAIPISAVAVILIFLTLVYYATRNIDIG